MVDKHLFQIYLGVMIMKRKLSSPDHVSAIEINLLEKWVLFLIFIFIKNQTTFRGQSISYLMICWKPFKGMLMQISWR